MPLTTSLRAPAARVPSPSRTASRCAGGRPCCSWRLAPGDAWRSRSEVGRRGAGRPRSSRRSSTRRRWPTPATRSAFTPGDRVSVPFKPRQSDRWAVGGVAAARAPGRPPERQGARCAPAAATRSDHLRDATGGSRRPAPSARPTVPYVDPGAAAVRADLAAAVDPGGLKREVFGFLPYWELTDSSTRLDWEKLSTIAYFGVGAAGNGDLQRKNSDGSTTVGWGGWTSSKMTSVMNAAHASGARVVLTVQSFAWTSAGVARQRSLLGSSANRANLARQIAAAVRDRGADGVNLDFEPIISAYSDEFTALVRSVRAELNKVARGYQMTFDTTGWIGNYPIGDATALGRRRRRGGHGLRLPDRIVERRSARSRRSAARPTTSATRSAPISPGSRHPRSSSASRTTAGPGRPRPRRLDAKNISGAKNGASTTVRLRHRRPVRRRPRPQVGPGRGRRLDRLPAPELHGDLRLRQPVARAVLRRRQGARAQVRPDQPLQPARRRDLGARLRRHADRAVRDAQGQVHHRQGPAGDHRPRRSASRSSRPTATGGWTPSTVRVTATGLIRFGWTVQPIVQRRRRRRGPDGRRHRARPPPSPGTARTAAARSSATGRTGSRSGPPTPRTTAPRPARS